MGLEINGKRINNLRFADDVVLVAESAEHLQIMLDDLYSESKKAGMEINLSKTKIFSNENNQKPIKIGETCLERTDKIIYLGQLISLQNQTENEVKRRIEVLELKPYPQTKLSHLLQKPTV